MQSITPILAGFGALVILWQIARLAWYGISQAALWLHIYRRSTYSAMVADRMKRYV